tara:strand:+ start:1016 stop:1279 length:264 start_codon:yes stop_codon:yes gene_type:complete
MDTEACTIIDGLGGTTATARLTQAPVSTVFSWRKNGIPQSRMAHLRLAADAKGLEWPVADHADAPTAPAKSASCGKSGDVAAQERAA